MDDAILRDICMVWPSKTNVFFRQRMLCQYIHGQWFYCVDLCFLADFSLDCSRGGVAGTLRVGGAMDDTILRDICMVWPSKTNVLFRQRMLCQYILGQWFYGVDL